MTLDDLWRIVVAAIVTGFVARVISQERNRRRLADLERDLLRKERDIACETRRRMGPKP